MKSFLKILLALLLSSLLIAENSCKSKHYFEVARSFYYWKTSYDFSDKDKAYADSLHIQKMYIKCFDIDWSENAAKAVPVGVLNTTSYMHLPFEKVIPCIYILNIVMEKSSEFELFELAQKIGEKLSQTFSDFANSYTYTKTTGWDDPVYAEGNKYTQHERDIILNRIDSTKDAMKKDWLWQANEIQFDCDWTEKSKENYFYFLKKIKELFPDKTISCTLRLWQYNNRKIAGTPPVDRCMLMCYSVGNPRRYDGKNSIANAEDMKAYLVKSKYSLPLDIALPVFSWGVLFRNGHFKGILHDADLATIQKDTANFEHLTGNFYRYLTDTVIENTYVRYGDEIKIERIDSTELSSITSLISSSIDLSGKTGIAFFSWDTTYIKQYGINNLKKYYNSFQ